MSVACGYNNSAAVSEDGFLFFCGKRKAGLIGDGEAANEYDDKVAVFTQAQCIPAPVLMVSLGSVHTGQHRVAIKRTPTRQARCRACAQRSQA